MPSLAFRKASICSRFSFSASCTLVVNPQHATRSRLILYWKRLLLASKCRLPIQLSASMPLKLHLILRNIGKACRDDRITEAEIEKIFQANGFFVALGYEGFGSDLLAHHGKSRKRFDVAMAGFGGRVHAVIEFKKPSAGSLSAFRDDLLDKYVRSHLALYGVLTNGEEMVIYARTNG